jgi:hypothetical protein
MKNKIIIKSILSFALLSVLIILSEKSNSKETIDQNCNFSIELSMDSSVYLVGEKILLHATLKNNSNKKDSILHLDYFMISSNINIKNSNSQSSNFNGFITTYVKDWYTVFNPGEEINFDVHLEHSWGYERFESPNIGTDYNYFPADNYSVQISLKLKETILSNTINFIVKNPAGEEEIILEELRKLYKISLWEDQNVESNLNSYVNLILKYPDTKYIEKIYEEVLGLIIMDSSVGDKSKLFEATNIVIDKIPNSEVAQRGVKIGSNYLKEIRGKDNAIEFLKKIENDYPNTLSGKFSTEYLKSEEFNK